MKTVKALEDKHRRDLWADCDGYVWFYNSGWKYMWPREDGWGVLHDYPLDGEARAYGRYTRIQEGLR